MNKYRSHNCNELNVSDIDNANGFTITVGQKQADGTVVTSAGTLADS